jgi:ribosomal protein L19E
MTISQFHKNNADIADRIPHRAPGAMRPTKPARTRQNRSLMRRYKALKRQQAELRNSCSCHREHSTNHELCCGRPEGRNPNCPLHGDGANE